MEKNESKSEGNGTVSEGNGKPVHDPLHGRSVNQKVDYALFTDANLSRDTIKGWLKNDIRGMYLTLAEVLASNDCIEALTEVMYKRYTGIHKAKAEAAAQSEINFPQP